MRPGVVIIDRSNQPLTIGDIVTINGTYGATCDGRSGAWTLPVSGGAGTGSNTLSILQGDTDCTLTLTSVVTTASTYLALDVGTGAASPLPIPTTTYSPADVRGFATAAALPFEFYGNAIRTAGDGTSFNIEFSFSDNPTFDDAPTPVPPAATFTVTGTGVAITSPVYTLDLTPDGEAGLAFETVGGVTTVVGQAALVPPASTAGFTIDGYVLSTAELADDSSFVAVEAAFTAGGAATPVTDPILGTALTTLLVGLDPPAASVIIRSTHTETGVRTYQVLRLAFAGASLPDCVNGQNTILLPCDCEGVGGTVDLGGICSIAPLACTEGELLITGCTCGGEIVAGVCEIALEPCTEGQVLSADNCDCAGEVVEGACEIAVETCENGQDIVVDNCDCAAAGGTVAGTICNVPIACNEPDQYWNGTACATCILNFVPNPTDDGCVPCPFGESATPGICLAF